MTTFFIVSFIFTIVASIILFCILFCQLNPIEKDEERSVQEGVTDKELSAPGEKIRFSKEVLDDFRKHVGKFPAETGGMLASMKDPKLIDRCCFDIQSKNTPGTFYYNVEAMSKVYREWDAKGYVTNGIFHSHPRGAVHPSYHDISTVLIHLDFFGIDYFYLPIFQPEKTGHYTMYFYVVRRNGNDLVVDLESVVKATEKGYEYPEFRKWQDVYPVAELRAYRDGIDTVPEKKTTPIWNRRNVLTVVSQQTTANAFASGSSAPAREYFKKVESLYPHHVLDKVLVCIGTGGARSFLENMARCGFRNFILMDKDIVSPTNVATQGVFISEMGRKKVDVIRERILDINPEANVVCVDRFLDQEMSDDEFKEFLDIFPNKAPKDYLILGCTDNFEAQKRSSFLALKYGMPYMAAMMYESGAAAEIIFVYPGVTESCPRCLLRNRFEKYENGYRNDVDSSSCPIFATERMNATKGYVALMLLMYREDPVSPLSKMLDDVKDRNFIEIRLNPYLKDSKLGIGLFDSVLAGASAFTFFDETLWIPQVPDGPKSGSEPCLLCAGKGDLTELKVRWALTDTRKIRFGKLDSALQVMERVNQGNGDRTEPLVKLLDE